MGHVSRRRFLGGTLALGAGGLLAACRSERSRSDATSASGHGAAASPNAVGFLGEHQHGITTPAPTAAVMVALDAVAPGAAALTTGFRRLSDEIRALSVDGPGDGGAAGAVSVIVAAGASLFDERYGLAGRAPSELVTMPTFANDELDAARTHGDLLLTVSADRGEAADAARRRLVASTGDAFAQRWTLAGANERALPEEPPRNAMGFLDGTSNPDATSEGLMRLFVWVQARDDEPDWATRGTYQAVRVIRMHLDDWDALEVAEQERIIGRRKRSGAPLSGGSAHDEPEHRNDPDGAVTPLDAHIRLANPRDRATHYEEILRRGFSYSRGIDTDGRADRGLAFVSFQRSLRRGFLAIQQRLDGEPLGRFTTTEGGGFYFALPGAVDADDWLGRSMLEGV